MHAGVELDPGTGAALATPSGQTSTYVQEAPGKQGRREYARSQNPTRKALKMPMPLLKTQNSDCNLKWCCRNRCCYKIIKPGR
ncbi:MAG: PLP-dependent transferase [Chitinophagaceae bacterium]|nr:PLP-dependent transferase [Chitinophagaceae bacterium]